MSDCVHGQREGDCWICEAFDERNALRSEVNKLRAVIEAFVITAESAIRHHRRPKGGQQVSFHGDFAHMPPSSVSRLAWWTREMYTALGKPFPKDLEP